MMEAKGLEFQGGATIPSTLNISPESHPLELAMIFQYWMITEYMRNGDGEKSANY